MQRRKADHLKISLEQNVEVGSTGFENYHFAHNALPEIDFAKVDTSVKFLGKKLKAPILISSQVRKWAPDILLFANLGAIQLNYGFDIKECQKAVEMIEADALILHLNPLQEAIQPEGDTNFSGLLAKIEQVCKTLSVPVIVKEVGCGISKEVARKLFNAGVKIVDTAGWGGTNWALIEGLRQAQAKVETNLRKTFSCWGVPTAESIIQCRRVKGLRIIGSGGIRNGVEIAKGSRFGRFSLTVSKTSSQVREDSGRKTTSID